MAPTRKNLFVLWKTGELKIRWEVDSSHGTENEKVLEQFMHWLYFRTHDLKCRVIMLSSMEVGGERNEAMIDHYYKLWILNPYSLEFFYISSMILCSSLISPNTYVILMQNE